MNTRPLASVAALTVAVMCASVASANTRPDRGSAAAVAQRLSRYPISESPSWRGYDEAPAQALVRPARVIQVAGDVTNPQALANPSSGQTSTLTYAPGGTPPSLILDYGKDVGGYPTFDVASTSGTTLQASYSETLRNMASDGATSVGLFQSGNGQRTDSFQVLGPGAVRASLIQGGERYEKVTLTMPGSVTLRSAGINFTPVRETPPRIQGHFLSSDDLLNRIWYAGAYTLNLNQMTPGTYVADGGTNRLHLILDGAKRDRAVWSGDHVIADLTDYYVSDPLYARDSILLFLTHPASTANNLVLADGVMSQPGPLPGACTPNPNYLGGGCVTWSASYSIVVMSALYNYYLYTGDLGFVREHWQAVERQMQWDAQQVDSNGLFSVNSQNANDWNLETPTGEVTYVNAAYAQALNSAAKLAAALGQKSEARQWSAAAVSVKNAVNKLLWNPNTGVYDPSNTLRGPVVQDANVTAVLAGIPTGSRARGIVKVLQRALATRFGPVAATANASGYIRDISPYMGSFNVLADFAAGNESAALALMRQEWGFVISHDPGGVDWERIQPNGVPAGTSGSLMLADSSAHAWSTGPTPALSQYVLGVAPAAPGYATWTVRPEPGNLRWAQGVVPTPHGSISVRWRRNAHKSLVLTLQAPRGTSGSVAIPLLGRGGSIARSGKIVWSHGRTARGIRAHRFGNTVLFRQSSGRATYAWAR
jgi:hypothetical protein